MLARITVALAMVACALGMAQSTPPPVRSAPAERQASSVAIISIHGPIDEITTISVERRIDLAQAAGAEAIVLEFDTPGGDMLATLQLCNLIKSRLGSNSVAWVRPHAFSAGAIISLAAREIVMAPGAAMGDAAPIQAIPGAGIESLAPTERAKLEAPIISEVVDSARLRGYDEHLVQAFVRLGSELWLLRNKSTLRRAIVDREEFREVMGSDPPREALVQPLDQLDSQDQGVLEPLITRLGQPKDVLVDPRVDTPQRARLDRSQLGQWELVGQVARSDQLLVVRTDEAIALGLAKAPIADERELATWFAASTITRYDETWSEGLVRFLTSWPVRIALIVVLVVGFVIEAITPGFGFFGSIAAVAFALLIGAPALAGLAQWWELIAVLLGLGLVALDIVLLPTGGWVAVLGGLLVMGGLVSSFVTRDLSTPQGQQQLLLGIGSTVAALFGSVTIIWISWRWIPQSRLAMRAVLHSAASGSPAAVATVSERMPSIGTVAIALTTLRPSGKVVINDAPIDAQTGGEFVDAGGRVRVVGIRGSMLEVEPLHDAGGEQRS